MDLFNSREVKQYMILLNKQSSCKYVMTDCQCIKKNLPKDAHINGACPFSSNMAELAVRQYSDNISFVLMYLSHAFYFNAETMKFIINEMMNCKNIKIIDQYYYVLERNLRMHPPCANYMTEEYEQLMVMHEHKNITTCFRGMSLWEYLMECIKRITSGSILLGNNQAFDLAFYKYFKFCVYILQMEYEVSKKNGTRPLIMKCLKYNSENRTRLKITKLLDKLFNTGYNFEVPVVQLAILIKDIKQI